MSGKNEGSWRCAKNTWKFCPSEGCPKSYGCARDHGWKLGNKSPGECSGKVVTLNRQEKISVR